jgi:hypothetical protein
VWKPPPPRHLSPESHEIELRRFTGKVPFRPHCMVDLDHACAEVGDLLPIGVSNADGVVQPLLQCPVCHAVLTWWQAYRP